MTPKSSRYRGVTLFRPTGKWRAQISTGGRTTSLGDHDTEEEAARAFDRAAINKSGSNAVTNFGMEEYASELNDLARMTQSELVASLRTKARRHGRQTSQYRGVSLLKQTGKWHAQINVGGKQLHLGFFASEELAARAYDRAAIYKHGVERAPVTTNFDLTDYAGEMGALMRMTQQELLQMLAKGKQQAEAKMGITGKRAAPPAGRNHGSSSNRSGPPWKKPRTEATDGVDAAAADALRVPPKSEPEHAIAVAAAAAAVAALNEAGVTGEGAAAAAVAAAAAAAAAARGSGARLGMCRSCARRTGLWSARGRPRGASFSTLASCRAVRSGT